MIVKETRHETFERSPEEALQRAFDEFGERCSYKKRCAFLWTSLRGLNSSVTYGSYKYVYEHELKDRKYRIEFWDGQVAIFYLDTVHNPRTYKSEPIENEG